MQKRKNYLWRDDYFMWIVVLSAMRSKDPRTQIWACIVNENKRIIWIWYNWFPEWCSDNEFPRGREWDFCDKKYAYVVHAEANAILNSTTNLKWSTIYVYEFPCNECAKLIIQSGIKEVKHLSNKYEKENADFVKASKKMFNAANIKYKKVTTEKKEIIIKLDNN